MSGPSAYVHSKAENADLSVSVNIIDNINGVHDLEGLTYIDSTKAKLQAIADALDGAADKFLQGYSLDSAQAIADNANEALVQLANRILYGSDSYEMISALTRNQKIKTQKLISQLQGQGELADQIVNYLLFNKNSTIGELVTYISKTLNGSNTVVEISEAGAHIVELGKLFDVQVINTELRKSGEAIIADNIFRNGKELLTKQGRAYRTMIADLIKSSKYSKVESKKSAIKSFCNKLGRKMHEMALEEVPFEWSGDPHILDKQIDGFISELESQLQKLLNEKKMLDSSNVRGSIGEEVREGISRAGNSVIISLQVGDLSEEQLVDQMEGILKKIGATNNLKQMNTFHAAHKMSLTDLVLVNNNTKEIARAQSKNHFVSYFTNNKTNDTQIDNFRWRVEEAVNLAGFIKKLSTSNIGFGMSLNEIDISNVMEAIANNLWQEKIGSYYSYGGTIISEGKSSLDFQKELEGSLEKLMAGQVVNLLGVTLQSSTEGISIDDTASNIFYILNGRLKRTADLVREAIKQIEINNIKKLSNDAARLVNVGLSGMNLRGIETEGFLIEKLKKGNYVGNKFRANQEVGEAMGANIINNIKITVSLGTSIEVLRKTSMIF